MLRLPKVTAGSSNFQSFDESSVWSHEQQDKQQETKRRSWIAPLPSDVSNTDRRPMVLRQPSLCPSESDKSVFTYSGSVLRNQPAVQFVVPGSQHSRPPTEIVRMDFVGESSEDESEMGNVDVDEDESITCLDSVEPEIREQRRAGSCDERDGNPHWAAIGGVPGIAQTDLSSSMCPVVEPLCYVSDDDRRQGEAKSMYPLLPQTGVGSPVPTPRDCISQGDHCASPRRSPTKFRRKFKENKTVEGRSTLGQPGGEISNLTAPISPTTQKSKFRRSGSNASSDSENNADQGRKQSRASHGRQSHKKKTMKAQSQDVCMSPMKRKAMVRVKSVPNMKSPGMSNDCSQYRSPVRTQRKIRQKHLKKASSFDQDDDKDQKSASNKTVLPSLPTIDLNVTTSLRYQVDLNRQTPRKVKAQSVENTSGLPQIDLMEFEGIPDISKATGRRGSLESSMPRPVETAPKRLSLTQIELPSMFDRAADKVKEDSFLRVLQILDSEESDEFVKNSAPAPQPTSASNRRRSTTEGLKKKLKKDRLKEVERSNEDTPRNQTASKPIRHRRASKTTGTRKNMYPLLS